MESTGDFNPSTRNFTTTYELDRVTHVICEQSSSCAHVEDTYMNKVMRYIDLYMNIVLPCILSVFTLCANIVNMMVLVKQGINTCVSLCLVCLSATDFLSRVAGWFSQLLGVLMILNIRLGFDPLAFSFFMVYTSAIFYDVSNTLTTFLSLERCLCVCLPLKLKDIFTFWRSVTVIVCIYLLCFGLLLPHFLSSGLKMRTSGNSTFLALWLSPDRAAVDVYIDAVHFCQTTVVMAVVFVCTLLMIVSLNHSSKFQGGKDKGSKPCKSPVTVSGRKTAKNSNASQSPCEVLESHKNTQSSRNLNVIKTVIFLCVICFICNLSRLALSAATYLEPRLNYGAEYQNVFQILLAVCYMFQLLNCSLNIFVYYRFNQSFRRTLQNVVYCTPDN